MVKSTWRVSGFRRSLEMGRTRPKKPAGLRLSRTLGGGRFGANPRTFGLLLETVSRLTPSKFNESNTTFKNASSVTSANDARITLRSWSPKSVCRNPFWKFGLQAIPTLGWKLLWSEEHPGIMPLACKHPPAALFDMV